MHTKVLFFAFTLKLSPARRIVYAAALVFAFIGLVNLFRGIGIVQIMTLPFGVGVGLPGPLFTQGTWSLFIAFGLMNLLVLLEVADRLSLKNDLEIAREIQQAMLPSGRVQRGWASRRSASAARPTPSAATSTTSSRSPTAGSSSRSATWPAKGARRRC